MSKRYYVSKIVGDGSEENPFRPKVADHGVNWVGSIITDENPESPNYGKPVHTSCFVLVNTINHAVLRGDPDIDDMPDFPLDGKVSSINTATKNAMITALQKRGFDTSAISSTEGYRETLQTVARQRDPNFNIDNFDVEG